MELEHIGSLGPARRRSLFERDAGVSTVQDEVRTIIDRVRTGGDKALREYSLEFDGVGVGNLDITDQLDRAYTEIDDETRSAIETAATNVREFHTRQVQRDWRETFNGRELGRRFRPLDRVGVYVPGGTAAYPSSAIMGILPAKVAGVDSVAVTTPPAETINPVTLAALHVADADEVYSVGGAQAIASLAYGTETIPRVQKVVGPGNMWVTAAKAHVRGDVAIDFLAGPSEILILADGTANPAFVAADMVAQAEHDASSPAVVVTDDESMGQVIVDELKRQMQGRKRESIIQKALASKASGVFLARSMSEAIGFAEEFAPEHLSIQAADDEEILARINSAGSVFLGPYTPVAAGDYASGTNHILPTNGLAKLTGGLSVDDFIRSTTVQRLSYEALHDLAPSIESLAAAEGLEAHRESVRIRFGEDEE